MVYGKIGSHCHKWRLSNSIGQLKLQQRNFRVAVIGASGGIGQPLSLLLKNNKLVTELALHDVMNVEGVAADLSHISTSIPVKAFNGAAELDNAVKCSDLVIITAGVARRPGMDREQLFEVNANVVLGSVKAIAKNSAHALIAIVTNPINAIVPMAAQYLKRKDVFDANRLFGVTTLDCVRAEAFIGNYMNIDPRKVEIPVIGGHAGNTILPIMSQCKPAFQGDDQCKAALINRIQMGGDEVVKAKQGKGSATLSMAFATARFANALLQGLKGKETPIECAYVQSVLTDACFFASPLSFGPRGIKKNYGLPQLDDDEKKALKVAVEGLKKSIKTGIAFADNYC
ncbi:malate dehydrogenase, mitochondrial-like [Drosophila innubila]|uniref:malate dehydrogenase, mitochondrial-like n=1 Tax=Drosophila innubila TaxID=198719 RepID=UPI00148DC692|nr:malate dehydrogenase, mitochondrial-like [Drosophila innubila]